MHDQDQGQDKGTSAWAGAGAEASCRDGFAPLERCEVMVFRPWLVIHKEGTAARRCRA